MAPRRRDDRGENGQRRVTTDDQIGIPTKNDTVTRWLHRPRVGIPFIQIMYKVILMDGGLRAYTVVEELKIE